MVQGKGVTNDCFSTNPELGLACWLWLGCMCLALVASWCWLMGRFANDKLVSIMKPMVPAANAQEDALSRLQCTSKRKGMLTAVHSTAKGALLTKVF